MSEQMNRGEILKEANRLRGQLDLSENYTEMFPISFSKTNKAVLYWKESW